MGQPKERSLRDKHVLLQIWSGGDIPETLTDRQINEKWELYGDKAIAYEESKKPKSGFFDLPKDETCKDREHNPPSHMVIPHGQGYNHVCPSCGAVTTIIPQQVSL